VIYVQSSDINVLRSTNATNASMIFCDRPQLINYGQSQPCTLMSLPARRFRVFNSPAEGVITLGIWYRAGWKNWKDGATRSVEKVLR